MGAHAVEDVFCEARGFDFALKMLQKLTVVGDLGAPDSPRTELARINVLADSGTDQLSLRRNSSIGISPVSG
jgi:hypothetical protein